MKWGVLEFLQLSTQVKLIDVPDKADSDTVFVFIRRLVSGGQKAKNNRSSL
jgi:hypothetical protein